MNTIYLITNKVNGKVYVGQTWRLLCQRLAEHRKRNSTCRKLINAFNKYGFENFTVETIATCDNQMVADYLEKFWITVYDSINSGYNIKSGGQSKQKQSQETKDKISKALKGKSKPPRSIEHSKKISQALLLRGKQMKQPLTKRITESTSAPQL